jgi:hypothetical protein
MPLFLFIFFCFHNIQYRHSFNPLIRRHSPGTSSNNNTMLYAGKIFTSFPGRYELTNFNFVDLDFPRGKGWEGGEEREGNQLKVIILFHLNLGGLMHFKQAPTLQTPSLSFSHSHSRQ